MLGHRASFNSSVLAKDETIPSHSEWLAAFDNCQIFSWLRSGDSSKPIASQTSGFIDFFRNIISSPEYGLDIQSIVNATDYSDFNFCEGVFSPFLWKLFNVSCV